MKIKNFKKIFASQKSSGLYKKKNLNFLYNKKVNVFLIGIVFIFSLDLVFALEAVFEVTSFSCSPSEVVQGNSFSCTAQIKNTGDDDGSVSILKLHPNGNWLEQTEYQQSSGTLLNPGDSTSVSFTGLRAVSSGNNGFSDIYLDNDIDNYVAEQNKRVNVINILVTVSNSASSAAMGGSITATSEVTAGGNIDVSLSFTSNSGGCSIGSQTNPKTISGMTDGSKQSRTWTITQGTSGNCQYTISAAATGSGGVASKIDSASSTITCTNCPSGSSSSSSSSGGGSGGSGGGGAAQKIYLIGELSSAQLVEVSNNEKIKFNVSSIEHTLTINNITETSVRITIESKKQTFVLNLGDEIKVDLDEDNNADISVKLKSINIITKKASIILEKISGGVPDKPLEETEEGQGADKKEGGLGKSKGTNKFLWVVIIIFVIIAIISIIYYFIERKKIINKVKIFDR